MRTILLVVAVTAGLLAASGTQTASAEGCLHRADFRHVESSSLSDTPMSRWQVHQLFGMTGRAIHTDVGQETRVYKGCGEDSRAWLQFESDDAGVYRVVSTAFTWTYFGDGLGTLHPAKYVG